MELKIPSKFKDVLDLNSALSGLINTSIYEFGEWLKQNNMRFFTEYTDHSLEHVENVLETANNLIRDECRRFLMPQDIATLILATLLHDCAMHMSEDGFINLVKEDKDTTIDGFGDKAWNLLWADFLAESRRFSGRKLIALFGDAGPVRHPPLDNPQQLNEKDRLLCGEFLRRHHCRLAHEISLFGVPGPTGRRLKLSPTKDTSHVVDLAGLVARSHGLSIRDCFDYLQMNYSSKKEVRGVHPTFLMALLRIADILQIQSKRAPGQVLKTRQIKSPVSLGEWEMHQAIEDISWKEYPETIWVVAKPDNVRKYLRIRNLLDQIQSELDASWTVIGEIYGYDSEFREFGLKIRRIRSNVDDIDSFSKQVPYLPVHASFEVADTDLLKLLVGPLYGDLPEIGIRELMQNSVDAVRELREFQMKYPESRDLDLAPQDGDVIISIDQESKDEIWVTLSDRGIGMTVATVKEYFLKSGASLRRSELWRNIFENEKGESRILRSGRFGVGALAAFLLGNKIHVTTRYITEPPDNGVEFSAELDTEAIELRKLTRSIGTTIRIRIDKETWKTLIHKDNWEKRDKWDWYCLDNPVVIRRVNGKTLKQKYHLPTAQSALSITWNRIKHPDYFDIHWTYLDAPEITCNGIGVHQLGNVKYLRYLIQDDFLTFSLPNVSVYDPDAKFPLNLQRTGISTRKFPFEEELQEDVIKDFIAYLLVNIPTSPLYTHDPWYHAYEHPAIEQGSFNRLQGGDFSIWYSTELGLGLQDILCDIYSSTPESVTIMYDYSSSDSLYKKAKSLHIPWSEGMIMFKGFLYAITDDGETANKSVLTRKGDQIRSLDEGIENTITWQGIGYRKKTPYLNEGRYVLISKQLTNILRDAKNQYSFVDHELTDYSKITKEQFVEFRNGDKTIKKRITEEWSNDDWILWKVGECKRPKFDFMKFAKENPKPDVENHPCFLAEWWLHPKYKPDTPSPLAKTWKKFIPSSVIPYNKDERQRLLADTYVKLGVYIQKQEEKRKELEKKNRKRKMILED